MSASHRIVRPASDEDWEPYRSIIRKLWWDDDRTLANVSETMRVDHGFIATVKQYKRILDKWDLGKNVKNHEMKAIAKIRARRRPKDTQFIVREKLVPEAKIDRFLRRTMGTAAPSPSAFSPMMFTPLDVFYYTPIQSADTTFPRSDKTPKPEEPKERLTKAVKYPYLADGAEISQILDNFRLAVESDDAKSKRRILESMAVLDCFDSGTLVHFTAQQQDTESLELLLDHGADINARSYLERTLLHVAMREGNELIVEQLLQHGADPNLEDRFGETPLFFATRSTAMARQNRYPGVLRMLLNHGADINARNHLQRTPLDIAKYEGNTLVIQQLLQHGVDPNPKDIYGEHHFYLP